jgi:hypothetical protein
MMLEIPDYCVSLSTVPYLQGSLLDFDPITQLVAGGVTSVPMIIGNIAEVFIKAISNPGKAIQDALNYAIYMHKKDPRVKMTTVCKTAYRSIIVRNNEIRTELHPARRTPRGRVVQGAGIEGNRPGFDPMGVH